MPTTVEREELARKLVEGGFTLVGSFAHSLNFKHESSEPVQLAFDPEFDEMIARAEEVWS